MKFCYCDETGTGEDPFAVFVGVIVDAKRMHLTKSDWSDILQILSKVVDKKIHEIHASDFYNGNGVWRGLDGNKRAEITTLFLKWFKARKHKLVFSVIEKSKFEVLKEKGEIFEEINSVWRAMCFHTVLAIQKNYQKEKLNKGNTIFILDEKFSEEAKIQKLILNPPIWSESYYSKDKKVEPLNQVIDSPYFADSKNVALIQTADFIAFFVRRYVEIKSGLMPEKYPSEENMMDGWFKTIKSRSISMSSTYPKVNRCEVAELFRNIAPDCIIET